ncbi:hypothetical protein F511_27460 [Dorcoceras hygrometricum]|uniref:Uncharacterized protein n=1 Tax=Dorcoceras hygrometricum TaxID=472368 RepID=A0A2Z7BJ62_9LAMI|nr:hypothetical protein F511_27460 [Dorcoceras hygrometricum]
MLPDQAELAFSGQPWYKEKASNLRVSDIPLIKQKGGMLDKFEVVLLGPEERAHRPPPVFHSFYVKQLEMGLRFPIPRGPPQLLRDPPHHLCPDAATSADRMGKEAVLKALKGCLDEGSSSVVAPLSLKKGKRKDLFVVSSSRSAVMELLCNMIPDRDLNLVRNAPDPEVLGSFAFVFVEAMVWDDEAINRLTWARREISSSRQSLDEVLEHHTELAKQLEELEAIRTEERRASEARQRALEAEKGALEAEKKALEAELVDTRAQAEGEIQSLCAENELLKGKSKNAWSLGKDEFLKSFEFDDLCGEKSLAFFECGFKGRVRILGCITTRGIRIMIKLSSVSGLRAQRIGLICSDGAATRGGANVIWASSFRMDRAYALGWGCHPRRCQCELGFKLSIGSGLYAGGAATRGGANVNWVSSCRADQAYVLGWGCHSTMC